MGSSSCKALIWTVQELLLVVHTKWIEHREQGFLPSRVRQRNHVTFGRGSFRLENSGSHEISQSCILQLLGIWIESCKTNNSGSPGDRRFVWVCWLGYGESDTSTQLAFSLPSQWFYGRKGYAEVRGLCCIIDIIMANSFSTLWGQMFWYLLLAISSMKSLGLGGNGLWPGGWSVCRNSRLKG